MNIKYISSSVKYLSLFLILTIFVYPKVYLEAWNYSATERCCPKLYHTPTNDEGRGVEPKQKHNTCTSIKTRFE